MSVSRLLFLAGLFLTTATAHAQTAPALPTLAQRYAPATALKAEAKPLYVVDGVALETPFALDALAPEDIVSITILKKAADTAPYGARAADGVVLITTKKDSKKLDKK